jgi:imidazolonepropionase-like amidohydrolase
MRRGLSAIAVAVLSIAAARAQAQVAVKGKVVHTMAGPSIAEGMVLFRDGKVAAVGKASDIRVPDGFQVIEAAVVTPGLIDAHCVVGLSGHLNQAHDQEQLEKSAPLQPELRAIDAYNPRDRLVEWVRGFGVTTIHTGHAPGELISGQTMVVKTTGDTVEEALVLEPACVAATLGESARKTEAKSPGTRGKMMAMLRAKLIQAEEYGRKIREAPADKKPERDLGLETLGRVLRREVPLLVSAQRAQDIASALRLAEEFRFRLILDGGAEATLLLERIKAAGVPVILHPLMARPTDELENASWETAAKLRAAGIRVALQSGYESYVPKTRVVLLEAAVAAANGLSFEEALAAITIDAARVLGVDGRVGSLAVGKDGDAALFDGDPFEYTTHCTAVVIGGRVVSAAAR